MSTTTDPFDLAPTTAPEITTAAPRRPEWDAVRETTALITHHGRQFLRGQVRLGMLLSGLKKAYGVQQGGDKKSTDGIRPLILWKDLVKQETGIERPRADEFIRLYESTVAKLKRTKYLAEIPGPASDALVLFQPENAAALTPQQWEMVDQIIGTLTTGETQSTLLTELGVVAKPRPMPTGGGTPAPPDDTITAGQLAFHFFEGMTESLVNTRCNPDYLMLLHALPLTSTTEHPLSLAYIEAEARALLHDIERVKEATAKPTKGRVLGS